MVKKIYIYFLFIFALSTHSVSAIDGEIIGSDVRLRDKANTKSKIIALLNEGDKVEFLESKSDYIFIGQYHGKWLKVKYKDFEGFVFSAFVKADGLYEEKFHIFFEKFFDIICRDSYGKHIIYLQVCNRFSRERWKLSKDETFPKGKLSILKQERDFALSRVLFPLEFLVLCYEEYSESGECKDVTHKIKKTDIWLPGILVGDGKMETDLGANPKGKFIIVFIDFIGTEGFFYWHFKPVNGRWFLKNVMSNLEP